MWKSLVNPDKVVMFQLHEGVVLEEEHLLQQLALPLQQHALAAAEATTAAGVGKTTGASLRKGVLVATSAANGASTGYTNGFMLNPLVDLAWSESGMAMGSVSSAHAVELVAGIGPQMRSGAKDVHVRGGSCAMFEVHHQSNCWQEGSVLRTAAHVPTAASATAAGAVQVDVAAAKQASEQPVVFGQQEGGTSTSKQASIPKVSFAASCILFRALRVGGALRVVCMKHCNLFRA
jgi:hypothetical protein